MTVINKGKQLRKAKLQLLVERFIFVSLFIIMILLGPVNTIGFLATILNVSFILLDFILKSKGYLIEVKTCLNGWKLALVWLLAFSLWVFLAMGLITLNMFLLGTVLLLTLITICEIISLKYENIKNN